MPASIRLPIGYETTMESCPVCREPGMTVKHGYDEIGALHLENCRNVDCSEFGEHIVIVGYNCPICVAQLSSIRSHKS